MRSTLGDATVELSLKPLRSLLESLLAQESLPPHRVSLAQDQALLAELQKYMPKQLADKIRASGHIQSERRHVTVLFADLSGFTALPERLDPEEVASLFAEETPESIAKNELRSLLTIYKDAQQHPEFSAHEQRRSELIAKELKAATARFCSCAPTWMRCRSRRKPACCGLASAPTEFNDIPKDAPSSPVARNSATARLLVE